MAQGLWAVFWPPDSAWEKLAPILEELSEKDRARFRAIPQDPRGDERRRQLLFSRALLPFALQEALPTVPQNPTPAPGPDPRSSAVFPLFAAPEAPPEPANPEKTARFTARPGPAAPAKLPLSAAPAPLADPAEALTSAGFSAIFAPAEPLAFAAREAAAAPVEVPVGADPGDPAAGEIWGPAGPAASAESLRASRFLALAKTPAGQPYLPGCPELFLSLSHTAGAAILAVSDTPVGVDIERFRPVPRHLSRNFDGNRNDFWASWTKAEAAAKRRGRGLDVVLPLARKGFPPPLDAREIPLPGPYAAAVSGTGPFPLHIVPLSALFSAFSPENDRK